MKTKLPVIAIIAILVSACTTGTYVTRTFDDDIYFSPADIPPVAIVGNEAPVKEKSAKISNPDTRNQKVIISQMDKNADGTTGVNNYIYEPEDENSDYQAYDMDDQYLVESDTTVYYNDDDVKYVINNYYDDDDSDIDFAYRINRFHRPYWYSPFFYDDWYYGYYSPFYSGYYGWGFDPWYSMSWGYPYSYYGYYSPFSFGFGGYWGGGYGYGYGGYGGYYGGYGGYGYDGYYGGGGGFISNNQVARRRPTNMNVPGGGLNSNNAAMGGRSSNLKGGSSENQSGGQLNNSTAPNTWIENGHVRSRSINTAGMNQDTKNATIVNDRRTYTNSDGRRNSSITGTQVRESNGSRTPQTVRPETNTSGNVRRSYEPTTTGRTYDQGKVVRQSQNYTPSYNKPRIVNQSNYNNNSYTRPRTSESSGTTVKSASSSGQGSTYSQPKSSSSMRQTYRSSSSYSSGSSSSGTRSSSGSYSSPSRSSGSSYSAPARSSSGSSSGSSSSGGSSSGSSSGGSSGGGSGHRR